MLYRERGFNDRGCCLSLSIPQAHGIASLGPFYLFFFLLDFCVPYLSYIFLFAKEHMSVVKDVLLILHSFPVIYR